MLRKNAEEGKPFSLMEDGVFKAMLASDNDDSRKALRSLLSACIRREVLSARVINNEINPAHLDAKTVRLDVNVTFNDGESADLEMQLGKSDDDLKVRSAYYTAMLMAGQSKKGKPYGEIKRVYQIFFLNCILFPDSDKLPRRYSYREEAEHDRLTEATEIIFYEMPKLEQKVKDYLAGKSGTKPLPEDEKWCIFMKYREEELAGPLIEELRQKEEGIMHAEKALTKIDRDYVKYIRNMNILKNKMDRAQRIYNLQKEARAEGLAEGRTEGLAEGRADEKLEIARKMKDAGISHEQIHTITGLSFETIEQM